MSKNYYGWDCDVIRSGESEMLVTTSVGPRVIFFSFKGGENLFHVFQEDAEGDSQKYKHFGGHRLWTTPEDISYTYHVENTRVEKDEQGWYSSQPDPRGIQKSIQIIPIEQGFKVSHRLVNVGGQEVSSSPWGITMLRAGGFGFFPDEPKRSHGSTSFLPVRSLSLWSYTKMNDPRLHFEEGCTKIVQKPGLGAFKLGAYVSPGWGGYYLNGVVFLKTFNGQPDEYPDRGANFEIYTDDNLLETETTGSFRLLKPGDSVTCTEIWQVFEASQENLIEVCSQRSELVRNLL